MDYILSRYLKKNLIATFWVIWGENWAIGSDNDIFFTKIRENVYLRILILKVRGQHPRVTPPGLHR
jgi:hypothetical protein